jgi:hypothetical protein
MCCRHGNRRQPPIVALAGAIYGAYQTRKGKRAEASAQDIGLEGGKYRAVSQQSHADALHDFDLHEKNVPPPDYEDIIRDHDDPEYHAADSKDNDSGLCDNDRDDDNAFLAATGHDENAKKARDDVDGVKMGFFGRLHARKEEKRLEREERREAWKEGRRAWVESRAERRAEWRAGRRGCGRRAC